MVAARYDIGLNGERSHVTVNSIDEDWEALQSLKALMPNKLKRVIKKAVQTAIESPSYWCVRERGKLRRVEYIIFVCMGNVCRSAFAEYYLRSKNLSPSIKIESCGLNVDQHGPSPEQAIKAADIFGVNMRSHISKSYKECDFSKADIIIPMEYSHYKKIINMFPLYKNKTHLLKDFAPWPRCLNCNIYDPYGQDEGTFLSCFAEIVRCLDNLPLPENS